MIKNRISRTVRAAVMATGLSMLWACESTKPYNYDAFMAAKPATIVVLPPMNESPEVNATAGVWAQSTKPLAEAGYYVLPVTLVDQTFRQNGVYQPADAHQTSISKLREVFGADAALYLNVKRYGTEYSIVSSATEVAIEGRLVDLRSGNQLWDGEASSTSADLEPNWQQEKSLRALLVTALIGQIVETVADESFDQASHANHELLSSHTDGGILPGPRSPDFGNVPGK
jgi:hypothetical protein